MAIREKPFTIRDDYRHSYFDVSLSYPPDYLRDGPFDDYSLLTEAQTIEKRGSLIRSSNNLTLTPPPPLSQVDLLLEQLGQLIEENKAEDLAALLSADFVREYKGKMTEEHFHIDSARELCGHIYTKQLCTVQPNIEVLILDHNQGFRELLAKAKAADSKNSEPRLYSAIIKQLHHLDLKNADLTGLDLSGADLSHSNCDHTRFAGSDFSNAVCIGTNFKRSGISRKQLADCQTYLEAELAEGFWPYWTEARKNLVLAGLKELQTFGEALKNQGKVRGQGILDLALQLTAKIKDPATKFNEPFQRQFLRDLHSKDELYADDSHYKRIIANLALCVVSGVVGYLIACAVNKKLNGHFTFFAKNAVQKQVESLDQALTPAASPVNTLILGLDDRTGAGSTIHRFLGAKKCRPNHPLGDLNVLSEVQKFLY